MKTYGVSMPVTGIMYKEVEAESEEEALSNFYESDLTIEDLVDFDLNEHITKGNVFYGMLNSVDIEELD